MTRFRITLEYDGTDFEGWQSQPGARTVQGELQAALERVVRQPCSVVGAGRTDAGVHAEAQVASVELVTALDAAVLFRALNAQLPRDLAVVALAEAPPGFHAGRAARGKHYRYAVWNGPARSPLRDRTHLWIPVPLDVPAMRAAAPCLVGTHDFAAFRAAGSSARTSVRRLTRLDLEGRAGGRLCFEVEGTGFLRHMVRALVGTLLEVGRGRRPPAWVGEVLAGRERAAAGPTAPARGLTLVRVDYGNPRESESLGPGVA